MTGLVGPRLEQEPNVDGEVVALGLVEADLEELRLTLRGMAFLRVLQAILISDAVEAVLPPPRPDA